MSVNRNTARIAKVNATKTDLLAWLERKGEIRETEYREGRGVDRYLFEDAIAGLEVDKKVKRGPAYQTFAGREPGTHRSWIALPPAAEKNVNVWFVEFYANVA